MITLPFSVLPGVSDLFLDYSAGVSGAKNFFLGHYADLLAFETHLHFLERRTYFRPELTEVLLAQNRRFGAPQATLDSIRTLAEGTTFCVITGQQVGIFTGPLYTIYKALAAKHLALWLKDQFPAYNFLPLFWLEAEDHDLDEAASTAVIDRENNLRRIVYAEPAADDAKNVAPVGALVFDERIARCVEELRAALPETEFTSETMALVEAAYKPGVTFADAFAAMLQRLFPASGLVFVDPADPELKKLLAPVILQELETYPTSGEEVIKRSAELEEQYHAQVKPRAVNLFYLHKGGRYPIEPIDYGFFLKGTRQRFTSDELLEIANEHPENFSPNVLLRPLFQDFLFPTAAYVAGPSEVAYFAQLQPVYDHFQVPMPIIFPRPGMTILEKKIQKLFNKFDLPYASMFDTPEELYRIIASAENSDAVSADFAAFKTELLAIAERLPAIAEAAQPSLVEAAKTTTQQIQRHVSLFEERLFQSRRERDAVVQRQLEKMQVYLSPEGKPQERQLNILTFLNRYGRDILTQIDDMCVPFPAEHRVLMV
ncbi:MAG: bacillithiol biosynthesis cysteine-adding enzyme BshC [Ignavibacteria bacterium]|nr:bacillithiol biosynthesis cysteine-adding enzyme BshC [Ignavibacteria bacterium]